MPRKSLEQVPAARQPGSTPARRIILTPARTPHPQTTVSVALSEMIAYTQGDEFTRLNLTGGKVLEVKETTDMIDRLVRAAAAQRHIASVPTG